MTAPLARLAAAVLDTPEGGETEAVRALIQELYTGGWITTKRDWYFEPGCREHRVVHLNNELYGGGGVWIEVDPTTGAVERY